MITFFYLKKAYSSNISALVIPGFLCFYGGNQQYMDKKMNGYEPDWRGSFLFFLLHLLF